MIIVDTSIWVDHFRRDDPTLRALISDEDVLLHPYVFGELLLAGLPAKAEISRILLELAVAPVGSSDEANAFIEWASLAGTGVGYVDVHLLLSARHVADGRVLTRDRRLQEQAERLGVNYAP